MRATVLTPKPARRGRIDWSRLSDDELLNLRLCDVDVALAGSPLEPRVQRMEGELASRGIGFRPSVWVSTDWFSPDGVPGFAIPFYLLNSRLERLERTQVHEVEGGSESWCMQLLRHEAAHALDSAYRLHARRDWRDTFGRFSEPYRPTYRARPFSRRFVQNLAAWYAQSHPVEDWAETFAVWLDPSSDWRERYRGWPALAKLEYVDALMTEIAAAPVRVRCDERTEELGTLRSSLRAHYARKRRRYDAAARLPDSLRGLFAAPQASARRPSAEAFLRRARPQLRTRAARATGAYRYVVDSLLDDWIETCALRGLVVAGDPERAGAAVAQALERELGRLARGALELAR